MRNWAILLLVVAGALLLIVMQPLKKAGDASDGVAIGAASVLPDARPIERPKAPPNPQVAHVQPPPMLARSPTVGGYPCETSDCASNKAGYQWAQINGIVDPDNCTGSSSAFIEGCRAYVQRRAPIRDGGIGIASN